MERRSFLSNLIIGSTGIVLGTSLFGLSSCSGKKVILALIGCGSRGTELLSMISESFPDIQVKYVCDVNDQRSGHTAGKMKDKFGYSPSPVKDMKLVFDDKEVNTVIIATPDHWHALATIMACHSAKNVFVEANLSQSIWEGQQIQEAAKNKRIVQVGFQNRSSVCASKAREYIQTGKLGQVVHVKTYNMTGGSRWTKKENQPVPHGLNWNAWLGPASECEFNPGIYEISEQGGWNNFWAYGGGILASETSHLLDLARMVLGDPGHPKSVYCSGGNWSWGSDREVPENLTITYDYGKFALTCETGNSMSYMKNGSPSVQTDQTAQHDWMRTSARIEIYGTEGLMYLGLNDKGWQVIGPEGKVIATEQGVNPDKAHLTNFIECIRERKTPASDVKQAHLSAALVHLGNIAYRMGNKQLLFDTKKEVFVKNEQANSFLKTNYRENYSIPGKA